MREHRHLEIHKNIRQEKRKTPAHNGLNRIVSSDKDVMEITCRDNEHQDEDDDYVKNVEGTVRRLRRMEENPKAFLDYLGWMKMAEMAMLKHCLANSMTRLAHFPNTWS